MFACLLIIIIWTRKPFAETDKYVNEYNSSAPALATKSHSMLTWTRRNRETKQASRLPNIVELWLHVINHKPCLLYTSPSPRDGLLSRMPSSA